MMSSAWRTTPTYASAFSKYLKRQDRAFQATVRDVIEDDILPNPLVGTQKAGDLSDFWVYKFKHNKQQYLIAYRFPDYKNQAMALRKLLNTSPVVETSLEIINISVAFEQLGSHENFYDELKVRQR
ncbi:type II toxin-antitoxin system RelE/ParE family toxin [Vitreoscilla filiformis]|nr:type II toxin-antitoxin system RelE/ParE family toxin [Vitreoscilla filiformis]